MAKTEIEVIYPGIPTDGTLDISWQKKHNPLWAGYAKSYPHLVPTPDEKKAVAAAEPKQDAPATVAEAEPGKKKG